jgi:hypothetical protein
MHKVVDKFGANGHLDTLDGIKNQYAQTAIEIITAPYRIKVSSCNKLICRFTRRIQYPKRVEITGESVVIDGTETADEGLPIGKQATSDELVRLLLKRKRLFCIFHEMPPVLWTTGSGQKKTHRITHASRGAAGLM